ncbi:MAG: dynamin family protein [Muribaculaceae bacterium]|nr:dynamin family protein [Muribaculaceae bacterium]
MVQFDIFKKANKKFVLFEKLVKEGTACGLDLRNILEKINNVKQMIADDIVRIVLLGSFSDGKTSAIAGLLGRLEDSMKIDQDESSDELKIYRPAGLKEGFEIVDTPGLFGTKEKEVAGNNVKYSDITKKYLSEAHIVIYVCDAVNPLKDSHIPVIKWIMRDLGKLNSTIFVVNKMDEAGYDLLDDYDYSRGNEIKRNALITRLRSAINLTPDEEKSLRVVCIAADPKGKGLTHWFNKPDDYIRRSHIDLLRNNLTDIVENSDATTLEVAAVEASIKDMLINVGDQIEDVTVSAEKALKKVDESCKDLSLDLTQLRSELSLNRSEMEKSLDQYRADLLSDIKNASVETISEVIDRTLGVQDGKVSFYVTCNNIDRIISSCAESNNTSIQSSMVNFEREFDAQNQILSNSLKEGAKLLKNVTVSGEQVKAVRDVIAKSYKFKPWGAIKLGSKITKGLGVLATGISIGIEVYSWYKKYQDNKKLDEIKESLLKALDDIFAKVYETIKGNAYYTNFAPSFIEMQKQLDERNLEVEKMRKQIYELEAFKSKIDQWKLGEYADFEVID